MGTGDDRAIFVADDDDATATAVNYRDDGTTRVQPQTETEPIYAWAFGEDEESAAPAPGAKLHDRLLWAALITLLCAAAAAVVWFSMTFYFQEVSTPKAQVPKRSAPVATAPAPPGLSPRNSPAPVAPPPRPAPSAQPPTPPPVSTIASPPLVTPPPSVQALPGGDRLFLALVAQIPALAITNAANAIEGAHDVCTGLENGGNPADAAAATVRNNPTMTLGQARALIAASIAAYCPQYESR